MRHVDAVFAGTAVWWWALSVGAAVGAVWWWSGVVRVRARVSTSRGGPAAGRVSRRRSDGRGRDGQGRP